MKIVFVTGPSGAGKSTFVQKEYPDAEVIDLYCFQEPEIYPSEWLSTRRLYVGYALCEAALVNAISKRSSDTIVLEHTMLKRARRAPFIQDVKNSMRGGDTFECVWMDTPIETIAARTGAYLAETSMSTAERPSEDEGFDSVTFISGNEDDIEEDIKDKIAARKTAGIEKAKRIFPCR